MLSLADNFIFVVLCVFLLILVLGFGQPAANLGRLLQWFWEELLRAVRDHMREVALPQDEEVALPAPPVPPPQEENPQPVPPPQEENPLPVPPPQEENPLPVPPPQEDNEPFFPIAPAASDSAILLPIPEEDDSTEASETGRVFRRSQSEPPMAATSRPPSGMPNRQMVVHRRVSPRGRHQKSTSGSQNESIAAGSTVRAPFYKTRKLILDTCNREPPIPETSEASDNEEQRDTSATEPLLGKSTSTSKIHRASPVPGPSKLEPRDQPTKETRKPPRGRSQRMADTSRMLAGVEDDLRGDIESRPSSSIPSSTSELSESPKAGPNGMEHGKPPTPQTRKLTRGRSLRMSKTVLAGTQYTEEKNQSSSAMPSSTSDLNTVARPSRVEPKETRNSSQCRFTLRPRRSTRTIEPPVATHTLPDKAASQVVSSDIVTSSQPTPKTSQRVITNPFDMPSIIQFNPIASGNSSGTILRRSPRIAAQTLAISIARPPPMTRGAGDGVRDADGQSTRRVISAPQVLTTVFERQQVEPSGRVLRSMVSASSSATNQHNTQGLSQDSRTQAAAGDEAMKDDRRTTRRVISAPQIYHRQQSGRGRNLRSRTTTSSSDINQREQLTRAGTSREATFPGAADELLEEDRLSARQVISAPQVLTSAPRRQQGESTGRVLRSMTGSSSSATSERDVGSKKSRKRRPRS